MVVWGRSSKPLALSENRLGACDSDNKVQKNFFPRTGFNDGLEEQIIEHCTVLLESTNRCGAQKKNVRFGIIKFLVVNTVKMVKPKNIEKVIVKWRMPDIMNNISVSVGHNVKILMGRSQSDYLRSLFCMMYFSVFDAMIEISILRIEPSPKIDGEVKRKTKTMSLEKRVSVLGFRGGGHAERCRSCGRLSRSSQK